MDTKIEEIRENSWKIRDVFWDLLFAAFKEGFGAPWGGFWTASGRVLGPFWRGPGSLRGPDRSLAWGKRMDISPPWSRVAAGDGSGRLFLGFGEGLVMVFECLRGFWGARLEITMEERSE